MGQYWVGFSDFTTSTSNKTAAKVIGASAKRFEVNEIIMTGSGITAPADTQHSCKAAFLSNATTGTAGASPTPSKKDQAANASQLSAGTAYSAEPTTYETNVFVLFGFNQRGGMRWAVPEGSGYKSDGGQSSLSFASLVISSQAGKVDGAMSWIEP